MQGGRLQEPTENPSAWRIGSPSPRPSPRRTGARELSNHKTVKTDGESVGLGEVAIRVVILGVATLDRQPPVPRSDAIRAVFSIGNRGSYRIAFSAISIQQRQQHRPTESPHTIASRSRMCDSADSLALSHSHLRQEPPA